MYYRLPVKYFALRSLAERLCVAGFVARYWSFSYWLALSVITNTSGSFDKSQSWIAFECDVINK